MEAKTLQVVEQIIAGGHPGEEVLDPRRALAAWRIKRIGHLLERVLLQKLRVNVMQRPGVIANACSASGYAGSQRETL